MNYNDLDLALTNLKISLPDMMSQIKFCNSNISLLGDYTISEIQYDPDKGEIYFLIDTMESQKEEVC